MPSTRRLRMPALALILLTLVVLYVTTAKRSTYSSEFYTRTMAAINDRQDAEARADAIAAEEKRNERVARLQDEHDIAMGNSKPDAAKQKPVLADLKDAIAVGKAQGGQAAGAAAATGVPGGKPLKDGRVVVDESGKGTDGVAKVGNVEPKEKETTAASKQTDEEKRAETEVNSILKRSPIIIFSKTYCPYSKKAKNILLGSYKIVPPPHVIELDEHAMGPQIQAWLGKSTGRATVPNVMVNGKSIGGGDDIAALHGQDKLIESIQSLGGKRIVEISKSDGTAAAAAPRRRARVRV